MERAFEFRGVAGQGDRHVDLQGEPDEGRVEICPDPADHTRFLELPNTVQGRRGGQADEPGELRVGPIGVVLELVQQSAVDFIQSSGHIAQFSSVPASDMPILR
ncbi:hypothetical protein GCM10022221_46750 [Actinocorallia aurea]